MVKLQLVEYGQYRVVIDGNHIGDVNRIDDDRWRLKLNTDPEGRKRRSIQTLRMMRRHILGLSTEERGQCIH